MVQPPTPDEPRWSFRTDEPPRVEPDDVPEIRRVAPRRDAVTYRSSGSDPTFGYLISMALAVGLAPIVPWNADLRYALIWLVMAGFGVLTWLFGRMTRIGRESPENIIWGAVFGLIIAVPMLTIGGSTLSTTVHLMFRTGIGEEIRALPAGTALALLVFVMPLAESLFFRGVMQENRSFWLVGVLSSLWSLVVFMPMLDIGTYPVIGVIIGIALVMMNLIYAYVRQRNGLAAAWVCQIVVNVVLLFLTFIMT